MSPANSVSSLVASVAFPDLNSNPHRSSIRFVYRSSAQWASTNNVFATEGQIGGGVCVMPHGNGPRLRLSAAAGAVDRWLELLQRSISNPRKEFLPSPEH
jgi:hypothetical protein